MADVAAKAVSTNDVKNGTLVVYSGRGISTNDDRVKTTPAVTDIETTYSSRFDDYCPCGVAT